MNILETIYAIQTTLFASLEETALDPLSEKEKQFIRILGLAQLERFTGRWSAGRMGRPPCSRQAIARAFVFKALNNFPFTAILVENLRGCKNSRRLCGWEHAKDVPSLSTFSRAFGEFAAEDLPALVHEEMIKSAVGDKLVGHISRDATEIEAREKAVKKEEAPVPKKKHSRGRPRKDEARVPKSTTRLEKQGSRTLEENLADLPTACDWGSKRNSKGRTQSWRGYKLHLDTMDGDIPVSALLTSASPHDSQAAIPLAQRTAMRVQSCYDLMDIAYDSPQIHAFSRSLGHVPLIAPNPRYKDRTPFTPAEKSRFAERSASERVNAVLKDNHGGRFVRVRGAAKVFTHLMFGVLVIAANQLFRLLA
jgi:hypothetical protein